MYEEWLDIGLLKDSTAAIQSFATEDVDTMRVNPRGHHINGLNTIRYIMIHKNTQT